MNIFLTALLLLSLVPVLATSAKDIVYTDATTLGINGQAFAETKTPYGRLPASAYDDVGKDVLYLSEMSTGLHVDFMSDSPVLYVRLRYDHPKDNTTLERNWHGCDLYVKENAHWRWTGIVRELSAPVTEQPIVKGLPKRLRHYRLYLPYHGHVAALEIGTETGSALHAATPDARKPIVCYGTSIVHGINASRAGMIMTAQLGRMLEYPVVNLGFSGNGKLDPELIPVFQQIEAEVFVIDCLPNLNPDLIRQRCAPFVKALRQAHPEMPIVLVENIVYQASYALEDKRNWWGAKNDTLKQVYSQLQQDEVPLLYYVSGETLLGSDGEATVDGTHPSDLGMRRLAESYAAFLRPLL